MKYSDVDLGENEAMLNKPGGKEGMEKLLRGELEVVPVDKEVSKESDFLTPAGIYPATQTTKRFDPKKFYQNNNLNFLWVAPEFIDWVVSVADPVKAGKKFNEGSFLTFDKTTTSNELLKKYPESVWNSTDLCVWLGMKLKKQAKGQKGLLLNNGGSLNLNLFPVKGKDNEVFVGYVAWPPGVRGWRVCAQYPGGNEWGAGGRFFSKPTD